MLTTSSDANPNWIAYTNPQNNRFRNVAVGRDGVVWAATYGSGLLRFDGKTWTNYPYEGPVAVAADGTAWVGIYGGLASFDGQNWLIHQQAEAKHGASAISIDPDNTVWVAFWAVGVAHFDKEAWTLYLPDDNLPGECEYIRDMAVGADGTVWVGFEQATQRCKGGLAQFSDRKWTLYTNEVGWTSNTVTSIAAADHGVWVGTLRGGISHFDGQRWRAYPIMSEFLPNVVGDVSPHLAMGFDNSLWVGISNVILHYNGDLWERGDATGGNIMAVTTEPQGNVWFAAMGGLFQYRPTERR